MCVSQRFADFSKATTQGKSPAECRIVFCLTNTSIRWFQIMTKYVPNIRFGLVLGQKIVHHQDVQISLAHFCVSSNTSPPRKTQKNTKNHQPLKNNKKPINKKTALPNGPHGTFHSTTVPPLIGGRCCCCALLGGGLGAGRCTQHRTASAHSANH